MGVASRVRRLLPAALQPAMRFQYERWRGLLERELPLFCERVQPNDRAVDVGANVGIYLHALARRGAIVEAFEPQPSCLEVLRAYADAHPRVHIHTAALGAEKTRAVLRVPIVDGRAVRGSASLVDAAEPGPYDTFTVDVHTLDSYDFENVKAIKIDVEGAELGVIRGGAATLERHHPLLLVEIEQRHHKEPIAHVFAEFEAIGYRGEFLIPDRGWRPLSEFRAEQHQDVNALNGGVYVNNFLFTRS